ncbi:MAG: glycosyltransferase [Candidatus Bathyarchaeota archaeon]|nr:glycosyltransferase [Candidatus Bathyarchaeota archaeon]
MSTTVSLLIPCYNEVKHLKDTINEAEKILKENLESYEILILEDGSTDGTSELAQKIAVLNPNICHIHSKQRLGKGAALKKGFKSARGEIIVFLDADSSVSPRYLPPTIDNIRQGYDICIGKRNPEHRKPHRKITSIMFNWITRNLLNTQITDHQCGLKAFKAETIQTLNTYSRENGWLWDTEVLSIATRQKASIIEIPVNWTKREKTSLNLITDPIRMLTGLLRIKKHITHTPQYQCLTPWNPLDYSAKEKTTYKQST